MSSYAEETRRAADEQIAQRDTEIERWRKRLKEVERERREFKKGLSGTGYRDDAEYQRTNKLADQVFYLKRSIREAQASKRHWRSAVTRATRQSR